MVLCPSMVLTVHASWYLCWLMVAFQCLNVWKCMALSRGFASLRDVRFLMSSNVTRSECLLCVKTSAFMCGTAPNILRALSVSGRVRGLLFFSGVMLTVRRWKSRSVHLSLHASPILMPVSLSSCRSAASLGLDAAISVSISSSVGMKGFRCSGVYFGLFHIFPKKLRYPV